MVGHIFAFPSGTAGVSGTVELDFDYELKRSDAGRTFVVNKASLVTLSLLAGAAEHVGVTYYFVKAGAGNVIIQLQSDDVVADSSANGTIQDTTAADAGWANLTLRLVSFAAGVGTWVILSGHGTWETT